MDLASAKMIGAGLACIALVGAGIGIGNVFSSLISAVARNPAAQPQVQDRQLLLEVGGEEDDDRRPARVVDGGARQPQHDLGGQSVAQLAVDGVGADDALRQLGPGVRVLVAEARAAEDGDRARPVEIACPPQTLGGGIQRDSP